MLLNASDKSEKDLDNLGTRIKLIKPLVVCISIIIFIIIAAIIIFVALFLASSDKCNFNRLSVFCLHQI